MIRKLIQYLAKYRIIFSYYSNSATCTCCYYVHIGRKDLVVRDGNCPHYFLT